MDWKATICFITGYYVCEFLHSQIGNRLTSWLARLIDRATGVTKADE